MYSTGQNSFGVILYYKPWAHPPTNHYLVCLDKCGNFFLENKARKPSPCPSSTSAQSSPSDEHGILSPRQSQAPMAGWQPPMAPNHVCLELTTAISGQTPTSSDRTNGRPSLLPKARRHPSHGHNKAAVASVKTWEQSGSSNKKIIKNGVKNRKDILTPPLARGGETGPCSRARARARPGTTRRVSSPLRRCLGAVVVGNARRPKLTHSLSSLSLLTQHTHDTLTTCSHAARGGGEATQETDVAFGGLLLP